MATFPGRFYLAQPQRPSCVAARRSITDPVKRQFPRSQYSCVSVDSTAIYERGF
jgi:hypothetical protein